MEVILTQQKNSFNTIQRSNHSNNYFCMNRFSAQDKRLSFQATGLLTYLLSLPSDWVIKRDELCNHKTNGRDATRTAFDELLQYKYIYRVKIKVANLTRFKYYLFEKPFTVKDLEELSRRAGFQQVEAQQVGSPPIQSTYKESTKEKIHNNKRNCASDKKFKNVKENVKLTEKQIKTLADKYSQEEVKWIYNKLSTWKKDNNQEGTSDYKAIIKWVILALNNEKGKIKANEEIKIKNLKALKEIKEAMERKQVRGIIEIHGELVKDVVNNKSCYLTNRDLPMIVSKWYGWTWSYED